LTTDVMEAPVSDEEEIWEDDPSNPAPAPVFKSKLEEAELTISAYVDLTLKTVRPSYGAENDARILQQCQNYADKSGNYSYTLWFLEAEGISVVRSDGQPFRVSDILKLRSKDNKALGSNQAHALLAAKFAAFGVDPSFAATKKENTAIGHRFFFENEKLSSGGKDAEKYAKNVSLVPQKMYADGEHFTPVAGEDGTVPDYPRVVTPRSERGEEGAPENGGNTPSIPEAEVVAIIRELFDGQTPGALMQIVLDESGPSGRLYGVSTVFGVPILETATDESIVTVLQENRCMVLNSNGTLEAI